MRTLVWVLAWIAVAVWSLLAWGTYGLLDVVGGLAVRNADLVTGQPESVEWLAWGLDWLRGLGLAAIAAVWSVVSLAILAAAWVVTRILSLGGRELARPPHQRTVVTDASGRVPERRPIGITGRDER